MTPEKVPSRFSLLEDGEPAPKRPPASLRRGVAALLAALDTRLAQPALPQQRRYQSSAAAW